MSDHGSERTPEDVSARSASRRERALLLRVLRFLPLKARVGRQDPGAESIDTSLEDLDPFPRKETRGIETMPGWMG